MVKTLLLLALCASGLIAADVSGGWYLTIITQGERVAAGNIDIHQIEGQISFKFTGMEFKGDLDGDKVSLSGTNEGGTVTMKGAISGNRMEGDAVIPSGLTGKWS